MIKIPSTAKRKVIIATLALTAIATVLVAQNIPPKKEVDPAESGQVQQWDKWEFNFLQVPTDEIKQIDVMEQLAAFYERNHVEVTFVSNYAISPGQKSVIYNYLNQRDEINKVYLFTLGMQQPRLIGDARSIAGDFAYGLHVKYWLNEESVLLASGDPAGNFPDLYVEFNINRFEGRLLPIDGNYVLGEVLPYNNGTKLFYFKTSSVFYEESEKNYMDEAVPYYLDLQSLKNVRLLDVPTEVKQKMQKKQSFVPEGQNFVLSGLPNGTNGCSLFGVPAMYLPWICNKAMCVGRDGPQQCGNCNPNNLPLHDWNVEYVDCPSLNPGSAYTQACDNCATQTCGHTSPAIDFDDGSLWIQNNTQVLASLNGQAQRRYNPTDGGNYVIIRTQRLGQPVGMYVYTYYMHMSTVTNWVPTSGWIGIARGDTIGREGNTGCGSCGPHYHFQMRNADVSEQNSFYPIFSEYGGSTPKTGRTYISRNVPTDGTMQNGFDCSQVTDLFCNQVLTNQTTSGYSSRYATYGNGSHWRDENGPERLYKVYVPQSGTLTATISNVIFNPATSGYGLSVFILSSNGTCASLDPIANCVGSASTTSTIATATATVTPGTYYVVVDGFSPDNQGKVGPTGNYTITVSTAGCLPNLVDGGSTRSVSGRIITINAKLENAGYGIVNQSNFYTKFVLSPDINWGNDYNLVSLNYNNFVLLPGTSTSYTFNWTIPSSVPSGWYYLLEYLDYGASVVESNENNVWYFVGSFFVPPAIGGPTNGRSASGADEVSANGGLVPLEVNTTTIPVEIDQVPVVMTCPISVTGTIISATSVSESSTFIVANSLGQVVCQGKAMDGSINCSVTASGIYFLTIADSAGSKCVQKIFIKD